MKLKKIIFYIFILLLVFFIYKLTFKKNINYVALGDSLAVGQNSYGEIGYGYTDYIADYLKEKKILNDYTKLFSQSGYKIDDLKNDINNNKTIEKNNKRIYLKRALRESNLVTLSIGANDLLDELKKQSIDDIINNKDIIKERINKISKNLDDLIILLKKYAKGNIIIVGYYNPFPYLDTYKKELDELIEYTNQKYKEICQKNHILFIDISSCLNNQKDYFPNPFDVHPNDLGYKHIYLQLKKSIDKIND